MHKLWLIGWLVGVTGSLLQAQAPAKLESFLLVPEPRIMRNAFSLSPAGAELTVLTPARQIAEPPGIQMLQQKDFDALGISPESFATRARKAADQRLAQLKPEWMRDGQGKILYALYHSEEPIMASLLVAPSLPQLFSKAFGEEIWAACPTRHALYIFRADPAALEPLAPALRDLYEADPFAASMEIFSWKLGQTTPRPVASLGE